MVPKIPHGTLALIAITFTFAGAGPVHAADAPVGDWYGELIVDIGPDGLPFTDDDVLLPIIFEFRRDGTFSESSTAELGISEFLPGTFAPLRGTWERTGENNIEAVGISFHTHDGTTSSQRVSFRLRVDTPDRLVVTAAGVEFLPCSGNLTCPDPTEDVPPVPADAPIDLGTLNRLQLAD